MGVVIGILRKGEVRHYAPSAHVGRCLEGRKWRIKPKIIYKMYTAIIYPILTYAALLQWDSTNRIALEVWNLQKMYSALSKKHAEFLSTKPQLLHHHIPRH